MRPKALVTGSTGFLGINLISVLLEHGWDVIALHRPSSSLGFLRCFDVQRVEADILDEISLLRAVPSGLDAIFHMAGDTSMWSQHNARQNAVNVAGTRNVLEAARRAKVRRFIHTSSISAYGLLEGRIDESSPQLGSRSWINYHRSKFLAEEEVRRACRGGLDGVILNPASVFGPYDTSGWARIVRMIYLRKLPGVPTGALSFCHVQEVAKAHLAAVELGRTAENYLLGGTDVTLRELIELIARLLDRPVPPRSPSPRLLMALARLSVAASFLSRNPPLITPETVAGVTRTTFCDCSKAIRELGLVTRPLTDMVEDCIEWLRAQGVLERWGRGR